MLEIQFDPPFLHCSGANDGFFGEPGDDEEFIGKRHIIDVKIEDHPVFDLYEMCVAGGGNPAYAAKVLRHCKVFRKIRMDARQIRPAIEQRIKALFTF